MQVKMETQTNRAIRATISLIFSVVAVVLYFVLILAAFSILEADAGTCTAISRVNNSANAVLTSAKYNADVNTSYTAINAADGGCIVDGTVEAAALNSSEFAPQLNAIKEGCKVTLSNSNTVSVGKCYMTIDGSTLHTTSSNTATWGCTGCASESSSQLYYLYVKTGSTGTTMNLLISTTAPNNDGYDSSSNRVISRFYNNNSSDIDQYSIDQWLINDFRPQNTTWINDGVIVIDATTTAPTKGTTTVDKVWWRRVGNSMHIRVEYNQGTGASGSGDYLYAIPDGFLIDTSLLTVYATLEGAGGWKTDNSVGVGSISDGTNNHVANVGVYDTNQYRLFLLSSAGQGVHGSGVAPYAGAIFVAVSFNVPIAGWGN